MSKNKLKKSKKIKNLLSNRHRIVITRSNTNIYAQIIDDKTNITIVSCNSLKIINGNKTERANKVGQALAEIALKTNVKEVYLDKKNYRYGGRIKAFCEGARKAGLSF